MCDLKLNTMVKSFELIENYLEHSRNVKKKKNVIGSFYYFFLF